VALVRASGVVFEVIDERAVLVDAAGKELITLNPTGTIVWQALDGRRGHAGLAASVLEEYPDAERGEVERDVETFLDELSELHLVDEGPDAPR
jgi:hypothetical protein